MAYICDVCFVKCVTKELYTAHLASSSHRDNLLSIQDDSNTGADSPSFIVQHSNEKSTTSNNSNDNFNEPMLEPITVVQYNANETTTKPAKGVTKDDLYFCTFCNVSCPNEENYSLHLNGKKHQKIIGAASAASGGTQNKLTGASKNANGQLDRPYTCELCSLSFTTIEMYRGHHFGKSHKKALESMSNAHATLASGGEANAEPYLCKLCSVSCPTMSSYVDHLNSKKHKTMLGVVPAVPAIAVSGVAVNDSKHATSFGVVSTTPKATVMSGGIVNGGKSDGPYVCKLCNVSCPKMANFQDHINGKMHKKALGVPIPAASTTTGTSRSIVNDTVADAPVGFKLCNVPNPKTTNAQEHINGKQHKEALGIGPAAAGNSAIDASYPGTPPPTHETPKHLCILCGLSFLAMHDLMCHFSSENHKAAVRRHRNTQEQPVVAAVAHHSCETCHQVFPSKTQLRKHCKQEGHSSTNITLPQASAQASQPNVPTTEEATQVLQPKKRIPDGSAEDVCAPESHKSKTACKSGASTIISANSQTLHMQQKKPSLCCRCIKRTPKLYHVCKKKYPILCG